MINVCTDGRVIGATLLEVIGGYSGCASVLTVLQEHCRWFVSILGGSQNDNKKQHV